MKRILYVTTVGMTMDFFRNIIKEMVEEGYIVDIATNDSESVVDSYFYDLGCKVYSISCSRFPFDIGNLRAIGEIRRIVSEGNYEVVHCHTPIAAAATRIACKPLRKRKDNPVSVIYTAHGFHFYSGAPLKNWLIYYPIEKLCSRWTDVLITITNEDYLRAKTKFSAKRTEYVPGVGIDLNRFRGDDDGSDYDDVRKELGIPEESFVILSVGELNDNKNHISVVKALEQHNKDSIHYVVAGEGDNMQMLKDYVVSNGLSNNVHFLGQRNDVSRLLHAADYYFLPSIREGLNVSLMEAMASGLPSVCGKIRGNVDLIDEAEGGSLIAVEDVNQWKQMIGLLEVESLAERERKGKHNRRKIADFSIDSVNRKMKEIYKSI